LVAHEEQQVSVRRDYLSRAILSLQVIEMNRVWELYDAAARKGSQNGLPEQLVMRPDVTKVSTTVDQNGTLWHRALQCFRGEIACTANVPRYDTEPVAKPFELAEID
jgi:hypothetical protein